MTATHSPLTPEENIGHVRTMITMLEEFQPAGLVDRQKELAEAIANARKLKIDPDRLEVVQQLKAELAEGGNLDRLETQVYSDLHTFFSRYHQVGDFLAIKKVYVPYPTRAKRSNCTRPMPTSTQDGSTGVAAVATCKRPGASQLVASSKAERRVDPNCGD